MRVFSRFFNEKQANEQNSYFLFAKVKKLSYFTTMTKQQLTEQILNLYETNVGDFKRKSALYLNRFYQAQSEPDLKQNIQDLKNSVIYKALESENEMENIEQLRLNLLTALKKL